MSPDAQIQKNPVTALIARLAAYAGFGEEALEPVRMDSIVNQRMRSRRQRTKQLESVEEYLALVEQDAAEHDALLNEVLVGETKFFRDARVFAHLQDWLKERTPQAETPFRVLCAPCSTGEEAYSVAASLQLSGFTPGQYEIEALDISRSALEAAERGVYSAHALRGVDEERRGLLVERDGEQDREQWRVLKSLRPGLSFSFANLSLPESLRPLGAFDLILCRNLLIYLRPEARMHLLESLRGALKAGGRLIVGTGDAVPEIYTTFQAAQPASSFMLEARGHAKAQPRVLKHVLKPEPKPVTHAVPVAMPKRRPLSVVEGEMLHEPEDFYQRAQELYSQDDLRQAERYCRKALYLQPGHLPSLELLAQLWSNEPVSRRSRALTERLGRARARRSQEKQEQEFA
ncbi:MAG TPA: CheR family methyltransferase [Acidobacteriaceae bacterium]|jgi:chemotaxis methyl-accepting protein methylase|nr:CheR family methyltransferase [Acidobacteriaceae bacterium]